MSAESPAEPAASTPTPAIPVRNKQSEAKNLVPKQASRNRIQSGPPPSRPVPDGAVPGRASDAPRAGKAPRLPTGPSPVGRVILSEEVMNRFGPANGTAPLRAGVTAVYGKADGAVRWLGRPLHPFEAMVSGYRTRYDVGLADWEHEFDIADELPSRDDVFRFWAKVQFGFRVHDPAEVVLRRLQDGFLLARWRLLHEMRLISRRYSPEKCAEANDEINERLGGEPQIYQEGITVYQFAAFLSLDEQTQKALRLRQAAEHQIALAQKKHELAVLEAQNAFELEQGRIAAVRLALQGDHGLLVLHMARHPEDTEGVLKLVAESRVSSRDDQIRMFKTMMKHKEIQNIELQEIRDENIRQILLAARSDALQPLQFAQASTNSAAVLAEVTGEVVVESPDAIPLPTAPASNNGGG
jgi:hypothetical protein